MPTAVPPLAASLLTGLAAGLFVYYLRPVWDSLTARHLRDLTPRLRAAYLDDSGLPGRLRLWGVALLAIPLVLALVLGQWLLAIFAAFLLYRMPRTMVAGAIRKQRVRLRDQMVTACVNLANTTRAGMALPQGLETIAPETPEPLASEFRRIVGEFKRGRPFAEALRDAQRRLDLEPFTLFASAVLVCLERGGKVTDALDRISRSLLENQRLERKREADTASGRRTVGILAVTPVAFLALFMLLDPEGTSLIFTTVGGKVILAIVAVLDYVSVRWAKSILKLDEAAK